MISEIIKQGFMLVKKEYLSIIVRILNNLKGYLVQTMVHILISLLVEHTY